MPGLKTDILKKGDTIWTEEVFRTTLCKKIFLICKYKNFTKINPIHYPSNTTTSNITT